VCVVLCCVVLCCVVLCCVVLCGREGGTLELLNTREKVTMSLGVVSEDSSCFDLLPRGDCCGWL